MTRVENRYAEVFDACVEGTVGRKGREESCRTRKGLSQPIGCCSLRSEGSADDHYMPDRLGQRLTWTTAEDRSYARAKFLPGRRRRDAPLVRIGGRRSTTVRVERVELEELERIRGRSEREEAEGREEVLHDLIVSNAHGRARAVPRLHVGIQSRVCRVESSMSHFGSRGEAKRARERES